MSDTLNWIAKRGNQLRILSFDLGTETFGKVLLPECDDGDNVGSPELNAVWNCLCFFL